MPKEPFKVPEDKTLSGELTNKREKKQESKEKESKFNTVQNLFFQGVDQSQLDLEMDNYAKDLEAEQAKAKQ